MGSANSSAAASAPAAAAPPPRQTQLASSTVQSSADLDSRIRVFEKKRDLQERKEAQEWERAKAARAGGNVQKAKLHLRLRAQARKQIENIDAGMDKLYTLKGALAQASTNREVMDGMQSGTSALQQAQVDPEHAANVMTDLSLAMDDAQEATDVLTGTTLAGQDAVEAEAEDELAALEAELAAEAAPGSASATAAAPVAAPAPAPLPVGGISPEAAAALPAAPVHAVAAATAQGGDIDAELAALEAEMA